MFSTDKITTKERFKAFNEKITNDQCLEDHAKRRLTDEEAREIRSIS
ncbi:hypothetical protein ACFQ3N_02280 [Virgibacillus byunsanensis]|uniref:Uncharacterized protein n=1 Tax=Virgibacillus byunsanensis TaxID=570945 RepID=A0ABW3LHT8_9BACI